MAVLSHHLCSVANMFAAKLLMHFFFAGMMGQVRARKIVFSCLLINRCLLLQKFSFRIHDILHVILFTKTVANLVQIVAL